MIIRSQNKREITTDLNIWIEIKEVGSKDRKLFFIKNSIRGILGTYSTEKKAIKVLDMICNFYIRMVDVTNNIVQATKEDSYVFQMPSDEEVEV